MQHLYGLAREVSRDASVFVFNRLELTRRTMENHLSKASSLPASSHWGEDYGSLTCEFSKSTIEKRMPGGHKDGLAESLNAEMARLAQLRGDHEIASSATRCWPSGGDFAVYALIANLYSTTDQRHPIVSSAALLLSRTLMECPIRGERDVVAAIQTAQLLERMIRRNEQGANRFAPELFLFLRVVFRQLSLPSPSSSAAEPASSDRLFRLDADNVQSKAAFDLLRIRKSSKTTTKAVSSLQGFFSYSPEARAKLDRDAVRSACLDSVVSLTENCVKALAVIPSADALLADLARSLKACVDDDNTSDAALKDKVSPLMTLIESTVRTVLSARKPMRLQKFAPEDVSLAPRFLVDTNTAKRPNEPQRLLKKQVKRERKGVARELRLDGQFLAEVRNREKMGQTEAARAKRQQNFRELEGQQAQFNQMVRDGFAIKGAGVGGLKLNGRKMGKKKLPDE